ncbi:ferritin-like domain-containing protein [Sphingomonas sanguinis]|uniref:Ferritin-like domain-containing protein n=1 Tax=Sphingomonas sanguinis TaxID=33051 RepID=A0A7Y7QSW1_9SPHN|nr:ferritin-like domain-containing protein [Sphingomonas sanguinis]MBZ6380554.1 ferritin-like domain-containing protein [Sphingomonas sanguinis]NNG49635.1 ferritin-like domain-containing protein [Sphingomonas sanguinis]NNG53187.1 ferritin-like domain-containing protein [Sphingomonas sanguinis]NVP29856.1 ferritin-like domain-containing protein [Sphingomonas sanguinis]
MTTIAQGCAAVLRESEPLAKVRRARAVARAWRRGALAHDFDVAMPDAPGRPERPELLPPNRMPKRGRGGSEKGRIALLHALAHIEFAAIDLAFDAAGRFGGQFPRSYVDDWISVGADEAMHFAVLNRRLKALGSGYGELPAHAGLWESAEETAHDAMARLAVVPMVLEARGLDVTPETVARVRAGGDETSARILNRIYTDEIRHVGFGAKWFGYLAAGYDIEPAKQWQMLVRRHFRGLVKPPFNVSARETAGLTRDFYEPLADMEPIKAQADRL